MEDVHRLRNSTVELKSWAHVWGELVSVGQISLVARMNWVRMHTILTASNNTRGQELLYLCEMWRLQGSKLEGMAVGLPAAT